MADIINLRTARKQAERRTDEKRAEANRLAHGIPRETREREEARRDAAQRLLDGHRRDDAGTGNDGGAA